jgi:hypothetical protein
MDCTIGAFEQKVQMELVLGTEAGGEVSQRMQHLISVQHEAEPSRNDLNVFVSHWSLTQVQRNRNGAFSLIGS